MSDTVNEAVAVLNEKLAGAGFSGTAKFEIEGEGDACRSQSGNLIAGLSLSLALAHLRPSANARLSTTRGSYAKKRTSDPCSWI